MTRIAPIHLSAVLALALAACGGGSRGAPATAPQPGNAPFTADGSNPDMVPPEQMEEIQRLFERKRNAVSRCLSAAVDGKELPKNSRGKVTLGVVITPSGTAENVTIIRSTLESKMLTDCVIAKVKEIAFPAIPSRYETSYSYAFEAM